jgi:DNA-binding response OmpR family regulator
MVTARSDIFDVVAGLEAGADDYVTKPFQPKELAARIRALLRRARGMEPPSSVIRLGGDLEVLPDGGLVRRNGEDVHLTSTEFRLLGEMATSPGRLFTREMLLERVWATATSGTERSSTSTSTGSGPRSRTTRPTPATSSPCGVSVTRSYPDHVSRLVKMMLMIR